MNENHRATRDRLNDPKVRARLEAWKDERSRKETEDYYSDIFKDVPTTTELEFGILKAEVNTAMEEAIADGYWTSDLIELGIKKDRSGSAINNEHNVLIIRALLEKILKIKSDRGNSFWNTNIEDLLVSSDDLSGDDRSPEHNQIVEHMISSERSASPVLTTDEARARLKDKLGTLIPEEEKSEPFYVKVWFKFGIPTGLTFIASFAEIWRAFH